MLAPNYFPLPTNLSAVTDSMNLSTLDEEQRKVSDFEDMLGVTVARRTQGAAEAAVVL